MPTEATYGNLKHVRAVAFLAQKLNMPTRRWTDIMRGMHARAFAVAGAQKKSLVDDFHEAINRAISEGESIQWFRKEFDSIVEKYGWSYNGTRRWRSEIIYSTNLSVAYARGRYEQLTDEDTVDAFPYWRYVTMDDPSVRAGHRSWHNVVLPANHKWWDTHYPPNGWKCRCRVEPVSDYEYEADKEAKTIKTRAPKSRFRDWRNPSTKKIERIPVGIDPGWDYNPGSAPIEKVKK